MLRQFRSLGPYLAVELILPGGSIVALLLWTYRHRAGAPNGDAHCMRETRNEDCEAFQTVCAPASMVDFCLEQ